MNAKPVRIVNRINAALILGLALWFFILPFALLVKDLTDPTLAENTIPAVAYRWHQNLSPEFATWARQRVVNKSAAELDMSNISGTEWPIFSAVFYLWATEALQHEWQLDPSIFPDAPITYSIEAVHAAAQLIQDPGHATWVRDHWGEAYLTRENIFYRMLLISGLTSYQALTGNTEHETLLTNQVNSLAAELDQSPFGLLDDYPYQCYPIDVLPAIAAIQRADTLLGLDHAEIVQRSIRAFEDSRLDSATGLPAYIADSRTGQGHGPARGTGISYMLIWAPELWPHTAGQWYEQYDRHFWQEGVLMTGVREFSIDAEQPSWLIDVDAGPVFAGIGTAASAFGIGATRVNARFDQAYALSTQALIASWPLPNGTLLMPRLLSDLTDAPFVGETALLFNFTRKPIMQSPVEYNKTLPLSVILGASFYLVFGGLVMLASWRIWQRPNCVPHGNKPRHSLAAIWLALLVAGAFAFTFDRPTTATLFLLLSILSANRFGKFL